MHERVAGLLFRPLPTTKGKLLRRKKAASADDAWIGFRVVLSFQNAGNPYGIISRERQISHTRRTRRTAVRTDPKEPLKSDHGVLPMAYVTAALPGESFFYKKQGDFIFGVIGKARLLA